MATKKSNPTPAVRMSAVDRQWQAKDDLRTIQAASAIQGDAKRMAAAQKEAQSQIVALASLTKKK